MLARWNVLALALTVLLSNYTAAADCAAPGAAGCNNGCGKTCKLVSTTKKIVVVCYGAKSDQVCLPCPSGKGCTNCENLCAKPGCNCSEGCDCRPDCHVRWTEWCPGGAEMYCRKKLVKYEATKEIPWYKWVVVDCDCNGCEVGAPAPAGAPAPPAPPKAALTRPAPAGATAGMEFAISDEEMKQIQSQLGSASMKSGNTPAQAATPKSSGIEKLVNLIR